MDPAVLSASSLIAPETPSVEVMFTEDPVAVMSMSSPAAAPVAKISIPPAVEVSAIESAAFSEVVRSMLPVASRSNVAPSRLSAPSNSTALAKIVDPVIRSWSVPSSSYSIEASSPVPNVSTRSSLNCMFPPETRSSPAELTRFAEKSAAPSTSSEPSKLAVWLVVKTPPSATTNASSTSSPPSAFTFNVKVAIPATANVPSRSVAPSTSSASETIKSPVAVAVAPPGSSPIETNAPVISNASSVVSSYVIERSSPSPKVSSRSSLICMFPPETRSSPAEFVTPPARSTVLSKSIAPSNSTALAKIVDPVIRS